MEAQITYTAFVGEKLISSGPLETLLPEVKATFDQDTPLILIFEDQTGRHVDFALEGTLSEVLERSLPKPQRAGPGRPRLGVVSREISLLPRHWEWLEQQPNGASAAIRRLVEQARKLEPGKQRARLAAEAAARVMSALAGNLPGYEEASRALYGNNPARFQDLIQAWPHDIRCHLQRLTQSAFFEESAA